VDLTAFAADVGSDGPVTISGSGTRGGAVDGVRCVTAPSGIDSIQADEMIVSCGAATLVPDLVAALADVGQTIALPPTGTVGGALSVGLSDVRRLGYGPIRDVLLQAEYVSAGGEVVKAGGPTVKNVSGFDLCRLLVGSRGTLGFIGAVILRTRPLPMLSQWYRCDGPPWEVLARLFHPMSVLWDGEATWVLLEGHPADVDEQVKLAELDIADGPPALPVAARWSLRPAELEGLAGQLGFVAEVGVGVVHHIDPAPPREQSPAVVALHARLKREFDPRGRLNPGVDVLIV
jgi:glycolate dehydrogenase FAD-binding subunit